jgi:hypothetical protein
LAILDRDCGAAALQAHVGLSNRVSIEPDNAAFQADRLLIWGAGGRLRRLLRNRDYGRHCHQRKEKYLLGHQWLQLYVINTSFV